MLKFSSIRLLRLSALNNFSKSKNPSTTPRIHNPASLLNADQFTIDRNAHLKREKFIDRDIAGHSIVVEKALPEDDDLLIDFYVTHFAYNEPLNATLHHTPEEAHELMTALIKESTDNFMVREEDKVIGMYTLRKGFIEKLPKKDKRMDDYAQAINNGPFKHRKNNIIAAILEASEENLYDKMELPCTYYYGMMGCLHPKYIGKRIPEPILVGLMKYCMDQGARYYCGDNTGDLIAKLYCKLPGFEIIDKFYYADFKVDGKPLFEKLVDGSRSTSVIFCDLKKDGDAYLKN